MGITSRTSAASSTHQEDQHNDATLSLTIRSAPEMAAHFVGAVAPEKRKKLRGHHHHPHRSNRFPCFWQPRQRRPWLVASFYTISLSLSLCLLYESHTIFFKMERSSNGRFLPVMPGPISNSFQSSPKLSVENVMDSIHLEWHPQSRSDRFPSVAERVKAYMSNWYFPRCPLEEEEEEEGGHEKRRRGNARRGGIQYFIEYNGTYPKMTITSDMEEQQKVYDSIVELDLKFILHRNTSADCGRLPQYWDLKLPTEDRIHRRPRTRPYCKDSVEIIDLMQILDDALDDNQQTGATFARDDDDAATRTPTKNITPIVVYYGDHLAQSPSIPLFAKWRWRVTPTELRRVTEIGRNNDNHTCLSGHDRFLKRMTPPFVTHTYSPILWPYNYGRHFGGHLKNARKVDIPWERKVLGVLWRGHMTGDYDPRPDATDFERCRSNTRCTFVYDYYNSTLIDAGLTGSNIIQSRDPLNGVQVFRDLVTHEQVQRYKAIICFEGNDVSSALKWNLFSNSVVIMPPPTRTSWALEELLEPWVHFVPMNPNASNAEEMIRWVGRNDEKARRISERATLFMYDMMYHPDALRDDKAVKKEIVRRYRRFWR